MVKPAPFALCVILEWAGESFRRAALNPVVTVSEPGIRSASEELMEELMGSVVAIDFVLRTLMDLPGDVLPGDDRSEAIRELLTASVCREATIVGEDACRAATALIQKVVDRMSDDVDLAARLAEASGQRAC